MESTQLLKPVSWLIGKWQSVAAKGKYQRIEPLEYKEDLHFKYEGKPYLTYFSRISLQRKSTMKHLETGYLVVKPGTNTVALIIAMNLGITTVEQGKVFSNCEMKMQSKFKNIGRLNFLDIPNVQKMERHFKLLNPDQLEMVLYMQAEKAPSVEHLRVIHKRL